MDASSLDRTLAAVSKHLPVIPPSLYPPQSHNSRRGVAKVEGLSASLVHQACEEVFLIESRPGEGRGTWRDPALPPGRSGTGGADRSTSPVSTRADGERRGRSSLWGKIRRVRRRRRTNSHGSAEFLNGGSGRWRDATKSPKGCF